MAAEWQVNLSAIDDAFSIVMDARDHIDGADTLRERLFSQSPLWLFAAGRQMVRGGSYPAVRNRTEAHVRNLPSR